MEHLIYRFESKLTEEVESSYETYPLYDEENCLIGGFTVYYHDIIRGYVSGKGYPAALNITSGMPFYLTPIFNKRGQIKAAIISIAPLSGISTKVESARLEI